MSPRLPPRSSSPASLTSEADDHPHPHTVNPLRRKDTVHLTPDTAANYPYANRTALDDPRTSSTQSLRPERSPGLDRRILLVVYIHGFLGAEDSFRSFPAHVHNLLSVLLADTHVIHSKIYPRYQSRKNITFARDAFSKWLVPHEAESTDVILVGHSLGGILGAEVVLIPSDRPNQTEALRHRILGLVAFDTPFLGLHPSVIGTGIASLFRGAPNETEASADEVTASAASSSWGSLETTSSDPNFNPAYNNDIHLPIRSNKWERAWYFWNKHCGDLRKATQSYVRSHLEFGGCLADYPGLKRRYEAIRALEDVNDLKRSTNTAGKFLHRVRFVNYYTASTGRIKPDARPKDHSSRSIVLQFPELVSMDALVPSSSTSPTPRSPSPASRNTNGVQDLSYDEAVNLTSPPSTVSTPLDDLPIIPPEPVRPVAVDSDQFSDAKSLGLAQKDYARQMKVYEKACKDHQKSVKNRAKMVAKLEQRKQKEKHVNGSIDQSSSSSKGESPKQDATTIGDTANSDAPKLESQTPPRDRKFCMLPSKHQQGRHDSTWTRVYMEGVDEIVAHTSLFIVGETYAKLVGDTAERIKQWVEEDITTRTLLSEQSTCD